MKLLDKKTVAVNIATQRKGQIDEGIILAKKIDSLRQTLSSLQQQHQDFINGMSDELKQQTQSLQIEIDSKRMMLCDLEEERRRLLEPLTDAWNDYKEKERNLAISQEELAQKRAYLTIFNQELDERQQNVVLDEERIADLKKRVQKQADKVLQTSVDAQNLLTNAELEAQTIKENLKLKQKELLDRETLLVVKERDIEIEKKLVEKEKKEIIKTKAQLKDQRETLERAMARIKL